MCKNSLKICITKKRLLNFFVYLYFLRYFAFIKTATEKHDGIFVMLRRNASLPAFVKLSASRFDSGHVNIFHNGMELSRK